MDYQTKTMVTNALIKLVDNAPTMTAYQYTAYPPNYITKETFDIWVNYIFSVIKIISSYVDVHEFLANINKVIMQPNLNNEYSLQVNSICKIILEFARSILYL